MPKSARTQVMAQSILRMLAPFDAEGFDKVRLGRFYDGGYVMVDDFGAVEAAYSFGIKDDVSWDLDVAARCIDVFQYDHTIDSAPESHGRFHWSRIGLGATSQPPERLETLPALIEHNGHGGCANLLLKCDVEGAEWKVFASLPADCLRRFKQITMELHDLAKIRDPEFAECARKAIGNLTMFHSLVHVHANNWGEWCVLGGISVPDVIEVTLLRKSDYVLRPFTGSFPISIDQPNNPNEPDFYLGGFRF